MPKRKRADDNTGMSLFGWVEESLDEKFSYVRRMIIRTALNRVHTTSLLRVCHNEEDHLSEAVLHELAHAVVEGIDVFAIDKQRLEHHIGEVFDDMDDECEQDRHELHALAVEAHVLGQLQIKFSVDLLVDGASLKYFTIPDTAGEANLYGGRWSIFNEYLLNPTTQKEVAVVLNWISRLIAEDSLHEPYELLRGSSFMVAKNEWLPRTSTSPNDFARDR